MLGKIPIAVPAAHVAIAHPVLHRVFLPEVVEQHIILCLNAMLYSVISN